MRIRPAPTRVHEWPLILVAIAWICFGAAAVAFAQGGPNAPPPRVTVAKPVVKDIMEWDEFIGRFEAVDQVDIRARVSGYIDRIHFRDGSMVKVGDPLFTIDQRSYRLSVEQAETAVTSAQSRLEFATSDLERGPRSVLVDAFGRQLAGVEADWRELLAGLTAA